MKMNPTKLFVAVAISFAVAWVVCAAAVMIMPTATLYLAGAMVHLDLSTLIWSMTTDGLIVGLVAWSIVAGTIAWLTGVIYNRLVAG